MASPPLPSISRAAEKSSESMASPPLPSISRAAEKSSESMASPPPPSSIYRRISLGLGRDDSDLFLSTAVEDEKSKEKDLVRRVGICGMGGLGRAQLSRLIFRQIEKFFDGDHSDHFFSTEKSKDEKVMSLIHPASNLEPWRNVSPQGHFKRNITSRRKCKILGKGMDEVMTNDGSFSAVKEFPLLDQGSQSQGSQSLSQLEQEIKLYRQFEHENIVQCVGTDKMMGMSDAPIGSVTASTSFDTCPSTQVDCSDIDDSNPSLSTTAEVEYENDASPASNLGPWHHVKDENLKEKFKEWQKYESLEGSESSMYEVITDKGTFLAVKEFPLLDQGSQGSQSLSQLEQEIKLCRQFEHENIVQCIGTDMMMGMSDAPIGRVTASTSFDTCPSTQVDCSDIDDSNPSLSTAAEVEYENDASLASNLGPWHHVNDENLKEKFKEWQKYESLEGSESSMYEVITDKGTFLAVKEFPLLDQGSQGSQSLSQLEQKVEHYRQFDHENIVRYLGSEKGNMAVEDEKSKETDVVPIMGTGGLRCATLRCLLYGCQTTKKCLDGDDSDHFLSIKKSKDEKDMSLVHPASNLEPWRNVSPQGHFKRNITSWRKCKILKKGTDADVYEVLTDDGSFFAVKEFPLLDQGSQGSQSLSQLEQEIKLYRQFEHENIVQCIGTDKDEKKLYVFLELMSKGSLSTLYRKRPLTESQFSAYTRQILEGLKYLHDQNVIHRNIRCAMILVGESGSVKLDLGLANAISLNDANSFSEIIFWMAPEVVRNGGNGSYGLAADIWSLGCTVLEMLTCKPPFSGIAPVEVYRKIMRGEVSEVPEYLSRDAQNFTRRCLQVNPNDRPSAEDLLNDPFVKQPPTSIGFAPPHFNNIGS